MQGAVRQFCYTEGKAFTEAIADSTGKAERTRGSRWRRARRAKAARAASNRAVTTQKRARSTLDRATHTPERVDGESCPRRCALSFRLKISTEKMLDEQKLIERFFVGRDVTR